MTTGQKVKAQLDELEVTREELIDNLEAKGITSLSGDETLDELVPQVLDIPQPSGKITITENGTDVDISSYSTADVNVPGIIPTGTINITNNGTNIDVSNYASANVSVKYAPRKIIFGNSYASLAYQGNELNYEIQNLDTTNITNAQQMFTNCSNLTSLDLSSWNTINITSVSQLVQGCTNLTSLNVSNWNLSKCTIFANAFNDCAGLTSLDLSSWSNNYNANFNGMFQGCTHLMKLDVRGLNFTKNISGQAVGIFGGSTSNYVPANCEIIVKDATQKQWLNNNFSRMTNVKTVAEYEAEQN